LVLIDGLCQAYHWSLTDALRLTVPQVLMLNHAAWVNQKRSEERVKAKEADKDGKDPVWCGKKVDELNSDEFAAYWRA